MRNCLIILLFFNISNASGQLKISDLASIKVGTDLLKSRRDYDKILNVPGELQKSDRASSVYLYTFKNSIFNYCENADYNFFYVNDILSNIKIEMEYHYSKKKKESSKFIQSLETLLSSLNENKSNFKFQPKENNNYQPKLSNINIKKIYQKINNLDSTLNTPTLNDDLSDKIYWGMNFYSFVGDLYNRFLKLDVYVGKRKIIYSTKTEEEIILSISLDVTTEKLQYQYLNLFGGSYTIIDEKNKIDLTFENGVYKLPINLNSVMSLNFTLDLGASDVSISPDVFLVLYRAGTISEDDFIGTETYKFADGSTAKSNVFNLRSLKIGSIELKDVRASISNNINSPLLLGQSALKKLPSYKIDNQNNKLIID